MKTSSDSDNSAIASMWFEYFILRLQAIPLQSQRIVSNQHFAEITGARATIFDANNCLHTKLQPIPTRWA